MYLQKLNRLMLLTRYGYDKQSKCSLSQCGDQVTFGQVFQSVAKLSY